jgi:hypothetical protein
VRYGADVKTRARLLLIAPLAFAGAVAGHMLGYALYHPAADERAVALLATGHGSFDGLVTGAAAAGAATLVALALRAGRHHPIAFPWLAGRLVPLQLAIFVFLELTERGLDPARTAGDPAVLLGLVVQVVVGLGAALLARGVESVARSIQSRSLSTPRAPARFPRPGAAPSHRPLRGWGWDDRRRSPPLPLAA